MSETKSPVESIDIESTPPLDQLQSILFMVPAEVRNRIFQLTLTASPDPKRPYSPSDTWYRPGFHFAPIISTSLLLTCRRIYLENKFTPLSVNDHVFWYGAGRAPRDLKHASSAPAYFTALSSEERAHVKRVWWFSQQCEMENATTLRQSNIFHVLQYREFAPENMKITIRMTDWWWWERRNGLSVEPLLQREFMEQFRYVPDLQSFELELEMIEERKPELGPIIDRLRTLKIGLGNGKCLIPEEQLHEWNWMGPEAYNGILVNGMGRQVVPQPPPVPDDGMAHWHNVGRLRYRAAMSRPLPRSQPTSEQLSNTSYYVVSMVWKARDSEQDARKEYK